MDDVLIQNKYGEYRPLENIKVKASDETQLVYANDFFKVVNDAIDDIKHRSYFIGFRLDEANRCKYYEVLGYANIEELAEAEFGFKRSTTYGLMQAFNYAKSETPLNIADKFRGYSYTALLEMSKAKAIRGSGGIEKILTPKDSVSKIKEVRHYWNKYITDNGELPDCKTADEFLELVKKPAPAPLLELVERVETSAQPAEEHKVQSTGLTEPEAATLLISDKEYDKLIKDLDSLIKPKNKAKTKLLNLKNEKARKAWLDGFRSWGVWLGIPQVDKTFYRFDFANGAALIAEISAGYNDWYDGSVHEYERVEYSLIDDKHPKFNSHG